MAENVAPSSQTRPLTDASGGWPLVLALATGQVVSWGSIYYGFAVFVVPMEAELGWSKTALNGALTAGLLASAAFAYPVGAWIDRYGGRTVMTLGSAASILLLIAWSRVESLWAFYVIWIGLGASMAATLYEPVFAVVTRSFPLTFRTRITTLTLIGGFASTVFIPLTQLLIGQFGWRDALIGLALCHLAICLPIHGLWLRDREHGEFGGDAEGSRKAGEVSKASVRRALRHPVFWGLVVCFVFYYTTFSALTFHIIPLLTERGLDMGIIVAAYATIGPAQVTGRIVVFALGRRVSTRTVGRIVVLMFPASVLLLTLFPHSIAMLFVFTALYGAANGVMTIIRGTAIPDLLWREGYGAVSGALTLPSNLAKAFAPLAAALIWSITSDYQAVLWTILAGGIVSAVGFWVAAHFAPRTA